MRMRGLEPPPGFPDTDLNRSGPENMGPAASRTPISWGSMVFPHASYAASVAKLLPRIGELSPGKITRINAFE